MVSLTRPILPQTGCPRERVRPGPAEPDSSASETSSRKPEMARGISSRKAASRACAATGCRAPTTSRTCPWRSWGRPSRTWSAHTVRRNRSMKLAVTAPTCVVSSSCRSTRALRGIPRRTASAPARTSPGFGTRTRPSSRVCTRCASSSEPQVSSSTATPSQPGRSVSGISSGGSGAHGASMCRYWASASSADCRGVAVTRRSIAASANPCSWSWAMRSRRARCSGP